MHGVTHVCVIFCRMDNQQVLRSSNEEDEGNAQNQEEKEKKKTMKKMERIFFFWSLIGRLGEDKVGV